MNKAQRKRLAKIITFQVLDSTCYGTDWIAHLPEMSEEDRELVRQEVMTFANGILSEKALDEMWDIPRAVIFHSPYNEIDNLKRRVEELETLVRCVHLISSREQRYACVDVVLELDEDLQPKHTTHYIQNTPAPNYESVLEKAKKLLPSPTDRDVFRMTPEDSPKNQLLTTETLDKFIADFHLNKYPYLRLGQAAFACFSLREPVPLDNRGKLFNERDPQVSIEILRDLLRDYQA